MLFIQPLIVTFALLAGAAQALVAQSRSGEVSVVKLKQRQATRVDVVKRAIEKGTLAKRQGPSAVPIRCGSGASSFPGAVFYLSGKVVRAGFPQANPLGTQYYAYLFLQPGTAVTGSVRVSRSASLATPFTFDSSCNVRALAPNADFEFYGLGTSQSLTSVASMSSASYIDSRPQAFRPVCFVGLDGIFTCYTSFAPEGSVFCSLPSTIPSGPLVTVIFTKPAAAINACSVIQFSAVQAL